MSKENKIPVDPAAVSLMASIVARSLKQYSEQNPQVNLSADGAIRQISEVVAADMIASVAHLATQVAAAGEAPTRPRTPAYSRAAKAYSEMQKRTESTGGVKATDPFTAPDDKQHPETD